MKRLLQFLAAVLLALALLPANAWAFAVTADNTTIVAGDSVTLTFSVSAGDATNITAFIVGGSFDFTKFNFDTATTSYVGSTTGTTPPDYLPGNDAAQNPPLLMVLFGVQASPDDIAQIPFSVDAGPVFEVGLDSLLSAAPGVTTVTFGYCSAIECAFDFGTAPTVSIDITIQQGNGTPVPEPATLWLAFAALIAGGAVFRNGSKRS